MKLVYWAPYVGHVGTIKAVINSAISMHKYGGHEVTIVKNHSEWEGYEGTIQNAGVTIADFGLKKILPGLERIRFMGSRSYMLIVGFVGFFQLAWYIRSNRPDVLVTNLIAIPAILAALVVRRRPKIVASIQGFPKFLGVSSGADYPRWMRLEDEIRKRLWNRVYKHADLIVCMTDATRKKLIDATTLPAELFRVINNPVIEDNLESLVGMKPDDDWLFDADKKSIIAIGRLTRQKDFSTLIRALTIVVEEFEVRVAILGEGEDRAKLEAEISDFGLESHVRLYGFVDNPYAYLGHADLFVLTSIWEDPGHAILEAAALGIPIVTTDCPSGPAAVVEYGKAGGLCPVGDYECMAREMLLSLKQSCHREQVAIARRNAFQFSLPAHYEAFGKILNEWEDIST